MESYNCRVIFYPVMTQRSQTRRMFETSETQRQGSLLRFRSHFPDIRVPPFFLSSALSCETSAIRSIDRCRRRRAGKRVSRVSWPPKKGLILGIPRARTRQVRITQLGDSCNDNGEYKGGKSPLEQDQSSFSNLLDRMLYPRGNSLVGVRVEGTGKREEEKEPSEKRKRERAKKRFLNSRSGRPGASIPERFVCIAGLGGI